MSSALGEIKCSGPDAGTASVVGIVPKGVRQVSSKVGTFEADSSGFVSFKVPSGQMRGLSLDNGESSPLVLDSSLCDHSKVGFQPGQAVG